MANIKDTVDKFSNAKDIAERQQIIYDYRTYGKIDRYTGTLHDSNEGKVFWTELDALRSMRLAPSFDKMLDVFTNEDIQEYIQRKGTDGWTDILK